MAHYLAQYGCSQEVLEFDVSIRQVQVNPTGTNVSWAVANFHPSKVFYVQTQHYHVTQEI